MPAAVRRLLLAFALGTGGALLSPRLLAQEPVAVAEGGEAGARKHFERALELYRAGRYREALPELERAAELDPDGKDLFFNLALVHEKLGQLPEAVAALARFQELETDAAERERARLAIDRLRGAQEAGEARRPPPAVVSQPCAAAPAQTPLSAEKRAAPNPAMIGAASLAVASLVVGTVFGIKALNEDVGNTPTSTELPASRWHERARRADRDALVADIALALSAASTASFVTLWWLAPREPATRAAGISLQGAF